MKNAITATAKPLYIRACLAVERLRSGVAWWPMAPGYIADPYPAYRSSRERDPVHRSIVTNQFVVSRYADVDRILRDHGGYSNDLRKGRPLSRAMDTPEETHAEHARAGSAEITPACAGWSTGRSHPGQVANDGGLHPRHRPTRFWTGSGMRALLRHPEQLALLRERSELATAAVEELLRYDSPVQVDGRFVLGDARIGDKTVKAGSRVALLIGSANHDPEQFERPDELDITRPDKGNISFGRGIHHCLGAPLARLEGRIAFEVLLERFAEIGFGARPPKYRPSIVLRGLEHFDVRVRRGG